MKINPRLAAADPDLLNQAPAGALEASPLDEKFEIDGLPDRALSLSEKDLYEPQKMDCGSFGFRQFFARGY